MKLYLAGMGTKLYPRINHSSILMSYGTQKSHIEKMFKSCDDIFVDSGAFSVMTRGLSVNIDDYINWINVHSADSQIFASLDVIEDADKTWENYKYMREKVSIKDKLIFTYHMNEPLSNLIQALEYEDEYGKLKYIALGGMALRNYADRKSFLDNAFQYIPKDIKVHGFGMTDYNLIKAYPFYSVDSTTWLRAASFGEICFNGGRVKVSTNFKSDSKHYSHLPICIQNDINGCMEKYGFTLDELAVSTDARAVFNAKYLIDYCKDLNVEQTKRRRLF